MRETSSLTSDIWHLTSSSWRNYANTLARPALRRANVTQESRLHVDRRRYAQPGHRREHCDLQCASRRVAQTAALSRPGPNCQGLAGGSHVRILSTRVFGGATHAAAGRE